MVLAGAADDVAFSDAMEIRTILQQLLDAGYTQASLATRLFTTQQSVSRWLKGEREPSGPGKHLIRELAVEAGLLDDHSQERRGVPIMGFIGAGSEIEPEYEQVPPDGLGEVELPFEVPDEMIAFQVKGDSMLPKYDDGDVIVVWRDQQYETGTLIGDEVAVSTYDGKRYLKRIMPGSKPYTFTLESLNARPILDARIVWASEIFCMVPAKRVRKIAKKPKAMPRSHSTGPRPR